MAAALLALGAVLLWRGAGFYRLGLSARVGHPDFRILSPGGPIGHGYGVVGTALILTNLLYLARRRFARVRLGSMRVWLDLHVFTGLFGSVLVLFHSAFQLRSAIATLTSVSLCLVVLSGLIGRYFYGLAQQANTVALAQRLAQLDALAEGFAPYVDAQLRALAPASQPARPGLLGSLRLLPTWRREAAQRRALVLHIGSSILSRPELTRAEKKHTKRILREAAKLATDPVRVTARENLMRSWRGLHRFTAILMIVSVSVHITVAWVFGFRWIFSE